MDNDDEMLEQTNETENVETETTEEIQEGNTETTEAEQAEEKSVKTFTQEELDNIISDRIKRERSSSKRNESNLRSEYENKLAEIENVIKAGFATENLDEGISKIKDLCSKKGIVIPERSKGYSSSELEILAAHDANEIISDGYESIDAELKRLATKGADKMSAKEKIIFTSLNEEMKSLSAEKELASLGAKPELLRSKEYKNFADKFAGSKFTAKEVYEMYTKESKPKAKPIGSMINNNPGKTKEFISEAEYDKMTDKEIQENMSVIRQSMLKW